MDGIKIGRKTLADVSMPSRWVPKGTYTFVRRVRLQVGNSVIQAVELSHPKHGTVYVDPKYYW